MPIKSQPLLWHPVPPGLPHRTNNSDTADCSAPGPLRAADKNRADNCWSARKSKGRFFSFPSNLFCVPVYRQSPHYGGVGFLERWILRTILKVLRKITPLITHIHFMQQLSSHAIFVHTRIHTPDKSRLLF